LTTAIILALTTATATHGQNTRGFDFGSMGGYYTFDEVVAKLDEMRSTYPNLITAKQSIGHSLENRNIWMVKISDNPDVDEDEEEIFYFALQHSSEPQGMASIVYFMFFLLESYGKDPTVTYLVNNRELYFVPVVNPDGYVYNQTTNPNGGGRWRKNRRNNGDGSFGVDINRNFDYKWGYDDVGSSPQPSNEHYRGAGPASEPETQAIQSFVVSRHFTASFNYHSYGDSFIFPWGYLPDFFTPDHPAFVALATEMSRFNHYRHGTSNETVGYTVNGSSNDWLYGEQTLKGKIYALTAEVGNIFRDGFWPYPGRIIPLAQGNIYNNLVLAWGTQGAPPAIDARITPNNSPIEIPPQGGSFTFHLELQNNSGTKQTVQIWRSFRSVDGRGDLAMPSNITLAQGEVYSQDFTQNVGGGFAAGEYTYTMSVGFFPKAIDSDSFKFTKQQ
jgi:carboxypeptidase T